MRRLSVPVLASLAAACGPSPSSVLPAPTAAVVAPPSAPTAAPLPRGALCGELSVAARETAQALFQAERRKAPAGADGYDDALFTVPPIIGTCFEDERGAFVITLQQATLQEGWPQVVIRWALEHVDRDGRVARIIPTDQEDNASTPEAHNWLIGYPGSMVAEVSGVTVNGKLAVFTRVHGTYHEDAEFSRGRLFVHEEGAIVPHAPAASINIERIADEDADGVPDLVTYGPFDTDGSFCQSEFGRRLVGPLLLAHGLPDGAYSMSDEAAAAFAKKQCPRSPPRIVVKGREDDTDKNILNVACLRLWGVPAASAAAQVERECPPVPQEHYCETGRCSDHDKLLEWAALAPPLTLR